MSIKFILKKILLPILLSVLVFFLVSQDSFLYHEPVGKILSAQTTHSSVLTDDYNNKDEQITQRLTIQLLNQNRQKITISSTAMRSQTYSLIYRPGQQVILQKVHGNYQIATLKRDALMAAMITLFIGFLVAFVRWKASIFLLLSLVLNLIYFVVVVTINVDFTPPVIALFGGLAVIFAASSLLFVLGPTRQMVYTFITTILTTLLTFALAMSVLALTGNNGVHFEYLNYVTQNPSEFFFVGAIISVLGAIMDGTGDIVSGLFGLHRQNAVNHINMTRLDYFKSGLSIGQEIIGTLTNVLFMIFMAEALPITLLLLRNGNNWSYIATVGLNLGLLQTVISAIGIVLVVPVTAFVTSFGLIEADKRKGAGA